MVEDIGASVLKYNNSSLYDSDSEASTAATFWRNSSPNNCNKNFSFKEIKRVTINNTNFHNSCVDLTPIKYNPIVDNYKKNDFWSSVTVVTSLIAILQGVEVLCNLATLYICKDELVLNPATTSLILTLVRIPWSLKPLWAILSDSIPLLGYRRKSYIMVGSTLCFLACGCIGFLSELNTLITSCLLLSFFTGSAICNVIGEGLVVESGRGCEDVNGTIKISCFFGFRKLSFAIMSYLSGFLLQYLTNKQIFLVASLLPLSVLFASFWLPQEKCLHNHLSSYGNIKDKIIQLWNVIKYPPFSTTTTFIFILMATPSSGAVMFFYMTNRLGIHPELLGRLASCQAIASLIGIISFVVFFNRTPIRPLLLWSTLLVTPFCFLPIILVKRWNLSFGVNDALFLATDSIFMEFLGEFQSMPLLILAARICPIGLESSIYAFILSAYNLGLTMSSVISAGLTAMLHITAENFNNLSIFILICALSNIFPLFLLWLLPTDMSITKSRATKVIDNPIVPTVKNSPRTVLKHYPVSNTQIKTYNETQTIFKKKGGQQILFEYLRENKFANDDKEISQDSDTAMSYISDSSQSNNPSLERLC